MNPEETFSKKNLISCYLFYVLKRGSGILLVVLLVS